MTSGFFAAQPPPGYKAPNWPGLSFTDSKFLYYPFDLWFFIAVWSTLLCTILYTLVSLWAAFHLRMHRFAFFIPFAAAIIGALNGFIGGSLLGGIVSGLYPAGDYKMSTWIAFVWGALQALLVIVGSYSTMSPLL